MPTDTDRSGLTRLRRFGVIAVAAVALLAVALVTAAASAQPTMNVTVSPSTLGPGDTATVAGDSCGPDDTTFTNHQVIATIVEASTGVAYGSTQGGVSATGTWSLPVTAAEFAPDGAYEVRVVCQSTSVSTGTLVSVPGPAAAATLVSPAGSPTMTASPSSGERPLTVSVTGTSCGATNAAPRTIQIELLDPSLQQVAAQTVVGTGGDWSTTFTIATARLNPYTVRASCVDGAGGTVVTYPDQRIQVSTPPATLVVSPAGVDAGSTITATADRCPDPEVPRLGGFYFVTFTFEPTGVSGQGQSLGNGEWSATFEVPPGTAPGTYAVTATCSLEELGQVLPILTYPAAQYDVAGAVATPTPTPSATPTSAATPTAIATATSTPAPGESLSYPSFAPLPTAAPIVPALPATPTAVPASSESAGKVSFTG